MKCKLCQENFDIKYKIPRNLLCGHCFCEQCLKQLSVNEEVECPKCQKTSQGKLPICYAIFDIIYTEEYSGKVYCQIHPVEKLQFFCNEEKQVICSICLLTNHNGHKTNSIRDILIPQELKKEYEILNNEFLNKKIILENMHSEVEKYEDFLNKMLENQKQKLEEIGNNLINKKNERVEEYNKLFEINYLKQYEILNKLFFVTDNKKNAVEIVSNKISELLAKLSNFRLI